MLFTRDFIFLAFPKTGSSYVRRVVKDSGTALKAHHHLLPQSMWPANVYYEQRVWREDPPGWEQHGRRSQIFDPITQERPWIAKRIDAWKRGRERQVVSVWRDPMDRLVSAFRFQFYATWEGAKRDLATARYPHFPDWTLPEYHEWVSQENRDQLARRFPLSGGDDLGIGVLGWSFIWFYASASLLEQWQKEWPKDAQTLADQFDQDTQAIHFLRQDHLTDELGALLINSGLAQPAADAPQTERVNPTRENHRFKSSYEINEADLSAIRERESFIRSFGERRSLHS